MPDDVREFEWDDHNISHVEAHDVDPWECESVLIEDPRRQDRVQQHRAEEGRVLSLGITPSGRPLTVVWTMRGDRVRAVTARQMTRAEYARYRRW